MKRSINRNILSSELFVSALEKLGVKHACISPGSRNTPLTIVFENSKKIKSYVHVDERSSGFFALGLANKTQKPVVIVTTSGTAVVELYPAIVEAFQQKIPLLVCTADRPEYLRNTGANQTINQIDIFHNHILKSYSLKIPEVNSKSLNELYKITLNASANAIKYRGPVHINFPFELPFEPSKKIDTIDENSLQKTREKFKNISISKNQNKIRKEDINFLLKQIHKSRRRILLIGPGNYTDVQLKKLEHFAKKIGSLVFSDGLSGVRFQKNSFKNLIVTHASFLRSNRVINNLDPDLIIQIGAAPTSNPVLTFFQYSKAFKIIINEFGELKDPSRTTDRIIAAEFSQLFNALIPHIDKVSNISTDTEWTNNLIHIDHLSRKVMQNSFSNSSFPFEGTIINKVINLIPPNSNIMISNSLSARDFDAFALQDSKKLNIFSNRGASGIDGIISTSSGIAAVDSNPTFVLIGDLAFYHDITGLLSLKKYSLPLIIILLNNDGGGIFELLPIFHEKIDFNNYFKTPLNINFEDIVSGFKGNYSLVKSWKEFESHVKKSMKIKTFSVIEVKIDSKKTLQKRKEIWNEIKNKSDSYL